MKSPPAVTAAELSRLNDQESRELFFVLYLLCTTTKQQDLEKTIVSHQPVHAQVK